MKHTLTTKRTTMNNANNLITRRHVLQTLATVGIGAALAPHIAAQTSSLVKPTLHVYNNYGWLRGFNCIPSWGARIEDSWWFYDGVKMRKEMALARSVHANAIRLWIEFSAWYRDPDKVTASFLDAVAAIDENGMKVMPCLFNRWVGGSYDYGGTHVENIRPQAPEQMEYVRALVLPLANDPRVFCWDLCNEPNAHLPEVKQQLLTEEQRKREFAWLKGIADTVRSCGAQQPVTIGTMNGTHASSGNIEFYEPLMDVLCAHPYARDREGLAAVIADYKALVTKYNKPLLCNEGVPGCDVDEVRGEMHRYYMEILSAAGFGIMPWSIREGRAIATRRDRMDGNGINGKGFHPTFNADGALRAGHEWMYQKPLIKAPWEK